MRPVLFHSVGSGGETFADDTYSLGIDTVSVHAVTRHLLTAKVAGVGAGVFLLIFFGAFFLALGFVASRVVRSPGGVYVILVLLYGILLLILLVSEKEDPNAPKTDEIEDSTYGSRVAITVILSAAVVILLGAYFALYVAEQHYARRLDPCRDILWYERRREGMVTNLAS